MSSFSVTIIGLGNIGMMYDYNNDSDNYFLTHLKSFSFHKCFNIINVVDPDFNKLKLAKKKLGKSVNYLKDVSEINSITDIVVLACSTKINFKIYHELKSNDQIKLFVIEKPFWDSNYKFSTKELNSNKIFINYVRKNLPFILDLKNKISNYEFGNVIGIHVYYSKGIKNNGSHIIDLINYLFDSNVNLKSIKKISSINDYSESDKTYSFKIEYSYLKSNFPVIFQSLNERFFSLIEFDFIFQKARFRFYDFGNKVEIFSKEPDNIYEGYENLKRKKNIDTDLNRYALHTCNYIYSFLKNNILNNSNLINEMNINNIINRVKNG